MSFEFGDDIETPNVSISEETSSEIPCGSFITDDQYLAWKNDPEGVFKALHFVEGKMNKIVEELDNAKAQSEQHEFDKGKKKKFVYDLKNFKNC